MRRGFLAGVAVLMIVAPVSGSSADDETRISFVHGSYTTEHINTPDLDVAGQTIRTPNWNYPATFCTPYVGGLGAANFAVGGVCGLPIPSMCDGVCNRVTIRVSDQDGHPAPFFAANGNGDSPEVSIVFCGEPLGGEYEGTGSFRAYSDYVRVFPFKGIVAGSIVVSGERVAPCGHAV